MRTLRRLVALGALSLLTGVVGAAGLDRFRGLAYESERITLGGVGNAGRVDAHLYRGAQPSSTGFQSLKALGVGTVVSLTLGPDDVSHEQAVVESLGMRYLHLPWSTAHDPPAEHVQAFLDLLQASPGQTIFVHCKAGVDRTGVMVAAYRIAVYHWNAAQAIAEMNAFHFHSMLLPHLGRYVESLPDALRVTRAVFGAHAQPAWALPARRTRS